MSQSSARCERITAIVSTIVAVGILSAAVTAHQYNNSAPPDIEQMESDLRFQLKMAFRHDTQERARRLASLEKAVSAWQNSPQTEKDRKLFANWLAQSTSRSMPGRLAELPPTPNFSLATARHEPRPVPKATEHEEHTTAEQPQLASASESVQEHSPSATPTAHSKDETAEPPTGEKKRESITQLAQTQSSKGINQQQPSTTPSGPTGNRKSEELPPLEAAANPYVAGNELLSSRRVTVNLNGLATKIAGYHDRLEEVEATLRQMETPKLAALQEQIKILDGLSREFLFVRLYYESLTEWERETVLAPRPMEPTLTKVRQQLRRYETSSQGDFLGPFDPAIREEVAPLEKNLNEIKMRISQRTLVSSETESSNR